MKVALIIFRIGPSHGSILQTYALSKVIESMGHQVSIVDRQHSIKLKEVLIRTMYNLKSKLQGNYKGPIFYWGARPTSIMKNLNIFVEKYLDNLHTIYNEKELRKYVERMQFNAYVVGSDQTWRPKYVRNIYYYFLSFLEDKKTKRIAYAPSFGTNEWEYDMEQERKCKELATRFDAISVRERDAIELCQKHFNIEAQWVLDPTMLLTLEDYDSLIHDVITSESRIVFSILDNSNAKLKILNKVSNIKHLKLHRINAKDESLNAPLNDRVCPSIESWLSGIRDSSFVVADSFHATVFAIIFNKPFITIANRARGISRFQSLLESLGLEERLVADAEDVTEELINTSINWNYVNQKICEYRKQSIDYLRRNLQ